MSNPLLQFQNVFFAYRQREELALNQIDFSVERGSFVGVIGPTGAGKSTLIRTATGIVPKMLKGPFKGRVLIDNEPIEGRSKGPVGDSCRT